MGSLSGKTLFISGASRGIGLAIAKRAAAATSVDSMTVAKLAEAVGLRPSVGGGACGAGSKSATRRKPASAARVGGLAGGPLSG